MGFLQLNSMACVENENIFCTVNGCSLLLKIEKNEDVKLLLDFSDCSLGIFNMCIKVDDFIFIFGDWSNEIVRYNLDTNSVDKISVGGEENLGIFGAHYLNDRIFAFSSRRGQCLVINPNSFSVEEVVEIYKSKTEGMNVARTCALGKYIYFPGGETGSFYSMDVSSLCVEQYKLFENSKKVVTIAAYKNTVYLGCEGDSKIYWYDLEFKKLFSYEDQHNNGSFAEELVICDNKLVANLNRQEDIIIYELENNSCPKLKFNSENLERFRKRILIIGLINGNLILEDVINKNFQAINMETLEITRVGIDIPDAIFNLRWRKEKMLKERSLINLTDFIKCVFSEDS